MLLKVNKQYLKEATEEEIVRIINRKHLNEARVKVWQVLMVIGRATAGLKGQFGR